MATIRKREGDYVTETAEVTNTVRNYSEQIYTNKIET